MDLVLEGLYSEAAAKAGITTEIADLIFAWVPFKIFHRLLVGEALGRAGATGRSDRTASGAGHPARTEPRLTESPALPGAFSLCLIPSNENHLFPNSTGTGNWPLPPPVETCGHEKDRACENANCASRDATTLFHRGLNG